MSDKVIHEALNIMHSDPAGNLTVDQIARQVGISRTLFIKGSKRYWETRP